VPEFGIQAMYKMPVLYNIAKKIGQHMFLKSLKKKDIAYIWPGYVSGSFYKRIKASGNIIIREMINCSRDLHRKAILGAYDNLGWERAEILNLPSSCDEKIELGLSDFIFVPSQVVAESLIKSGVAKEKILYSSYGWDPVRFKEKKENPLPSFDGVTFLFVGRISVTKGIPLLFRAWDNANVNARLVLVGIMQDDIERRCHLYFKRKDVVYFNFQPDITKFYQHADVFVIPSITEGSPLVTYEAMSQGLAMIVTPMGSGGVVRNGKDGIILQNPFDTDSLTDVIRHFANNRKLVKKMGESARKNAENYTWEKVGKRRRELLLEKIPNI